MTTKHWFFTLARHSLAGWDTMANRFCRTFYAPQPIHLDARTWNEGTTMKLLPFQTPLGEYRWFDQCLLDCNHSRPIVRGIYIRKRSISRIPHGNIAFQRLWSRGAYQSLASLVKIQVIVRSDGGASTKTILIVLRGNRLWLVQHLARNSHLDLGNNGRAVPKGTIKLPV